MSGQVNIELEELTNLDQPSETTRFNPDDSERYAGNFLSSLSLLREIIVMLKGFVTIQQNFAEMQSFTIGELPVSKQLKMSFSKQSSLLIFQCEWSKIIKQPRSAKHSRSLLFCQICTPRCETATTMDEFFRCWTLGPHFRHHSLIL